jgi:hypothetical protein
MGKELGKNGEDKMNAIRLDIAREFVNISEGQRFIKLPYVPKECVLSKCHNDFNPEEYSFAVDTYQVIEFYNPDIPNPYQKYLINERDIDWVLKVVRVDRHNYQSVKDIRHTERSTIKELPIWRRLFNIF